MSVSYPDGRRPEIPSIIASFVDGHPSNNAENVADSFSGGGAAFSFETHLTTPVFGNKPDISSIMQTASHSHLMVEGHPIGFSGDYEMDIGNDNPNAHHDEDFDIDLDIADDGDIDLDLATPMGITEDDLLMEGVPQTTEEVDDVMADDAVAGIHNEDVEIQDDNTIMEQPQVDAPPNNVPSIFDRSMPSAPFTGFSQVEDLPQQQGEEQQTKVSPSSFAFVSQPDNHVTETAQTEQHVEEQSTETSEIQNATESLSSKPTSPLVSQVDEVPSVSPTKSPRHATPPATNNSVRISQAETVPLEDPSPQVNQKEWNNLTNPTIHKQEVTTDNVTVSIEQQVEPDIPTSPLQPSEHSHQSPLPADAIEATDAADSHYYDADTTAFESHNTYNSVETHPIVIVYRDTEFSLFPPSEYNNASLPETFFLSDRAQLSKPFSELVSSLRDVLGQEFSSEEELILSFDAMKVEFEEENSQMNNFNMLQMLELYMQLSQQDGVTEVPPLYISLASRPRYINKLQMIKSHMLQGGGLRSWVQSAGNIAQDKLDRENEELQRERDSPVEHDEEERERNDAELLDVREEAEPRTNGETYHTGDDELELEEFEKDFEDEVDYYPQDPEEEEEEEEHQSPSGEAHVDVPQSPSQDYHNAENIEDNPAEIIDSHREDSLKVPETQFSDLPQNVETSVVSLPSHTETAYESVRETNEETHHSNEDISSFTDEVEAKESVPGNESARDDEASFVTADDKSAVASKVRNISHSGSYGIIGSSGSDDEVAEDDTEEKDDEIDYNELPEIKDHEQHEDTSREEPEETDSDRTLPQASTTDELNNTTEIIEDTLNSWQNWNDWTYVEEDKATGDTNNNVDQTYHDDDLEYLGTSNNDHQPVDGATVEKGGLAEISGTDEFGDENDFDEFAFYPQQFSDIENPSEDYNIFGETEPTGQEPQIPTGSPVPSKRAREEDEYEDYFEENEGGDGTPSQVSKRHRAT